MRYNSGRCLRCTVNSKCSLHLSHSRLHICTPGTFQGIGFPPSVATLSHHLSSLFCQFPSLSSSAVFSTLWGGCSQAWQGVSLTPLTAHYSLILHLFHAFSLFFTQTQKHTHTGTHIHTNYNIYFFFYVLEEWKHQSGISLFFYCMRICVLRPIIIYESACVFANEVCVVRLFLC